MPYLRAWLAWLLHTSMPFHYGVQPGHGYLMCRCGRVFWPKDWWYAELLDPSRQLTRHT